MTNKKKKRVRDLSAKTGMSHQAAVNALTPKKVEEPGEALSCFLRDPIERNVLPLYETDKGTPSFVLEGTTIRQVEGTGSVLVPLRQNPPTEEEAWKLLLAGAALHPPVVEGDAYLISQDLRLYKTITRDGVTLCVADPEHLGGHPYTGPLPGSRHGLVLFNPHAVVRQVAVAEALKDEVTPFSNLFELLEIIQNYAHTGGHQVLIYPVERNSFHWAVGGRTWVTTQDFIDDSIAKATPSPWVSFVKSCLELNHRDTLAKALGPEAKWVQAPVAGNPVHQDAQGWWFHNETWSDRHGPYPTEREAVRRCQQYAEFLEYGPEWKSKTTKKFLIDKDPETMTPDWESDRFRKVKAPEEPKGYVGLDLHKEFPVSELKLDPEKRELYRKYYNGSIDPNLEDIKISPRPEGADLQEVYLNAHQVDSDPEIRAIYQLEEERAEKAKIEAAHRITKEVEIAREMLEAEKEGRPARLFEEYVSDPEHLKALFHIWRTKCAPGRFASRTRPEELRLGVEFGGRLTWFPMTMLRTEKFSPDCFEWWKSLPEGGSVLGNKPVPRSVFAPIEEIECTDLMAMFDEIRGYARRQRMKVRSADVGLKLGWAVDSRRPEVPGKHWVISMKNVQTSLKLSDDAARVELIGNALKSKAGREKIVEALNNWGDEPKA